MSHADPEKGPLLLCFDGSADAEAAIRRAAGLFGRRSAVVLKVWEPTPTWTPSDPATLISAPLDRLAARALEMDQVAEELAGDQLRRGVELAREAGFVADGRLVKGSPWHVICEVARELEAEAIVVGARGLSRVKSMLLGSVSFAVATHAERPVLVIPHVQAAR